MNRLMISLVLVMAIVGFVTPDSARAQNQVLLGERHVTDLSERDAIEVGANRGAFTGLRVKASGASIEFKRVVVHFENGAEQVFEKNRLLRKGDRSRVIDLEGGARLIDKVVFHYEARSKGWKGAELKLFGVR